MAGHGGTALGTYQAPPYFDVLFTRLRNHHPETAVAFGRHVHWGYWANPSAADGSARDYAEAAERLCRRVCDGGAVQTGQRVLDVGCGFGGTLASLNERFSYLDLVGVNIDARQLERARTLLAPQNGNRVRFVHGDACDLPLPAAAFDVVLAVECIFHFPSRADFFAHAARVLVPGGRLALSDFVPTEQALPLVREFNTSADEATRFTYGHIDVQCTRQAYAELGRSVGLDLVLEENIGVNTLPTYPFLRKHMRTWDNPAESRLFDQATARLEKACRKGWLNYMILAFQKR